MEHSEQINELANALAKAQGEIRNAHKDSNNPYYNSKYADIAEVWDSCRNQLSSNGLSVFQGNEEKGEDTYLVTMLMHNSGQWIKSKIKIPLPKAGEAVEYNKAGKEIKKNMFQVIASGMTYLRRVTLSAAVGIAPTDKTDDDAESCNISSKKKEEKPPIEPINLEEFERFIQENKLNDPFSPMHLYLFGIAEKKKWTIQQVNEYAYRNKHAFLLAFTEYQRDKQAKVSANDE